MFQNIVDSFLHYRAIIIGSIESHFLLIASISLALSALFVWGTVYMLMKISYFNFRSDLWRDWRGSKDLTKIRLLRLWEQVRELMATDDMAQWKDALLKADKILNEILKMSGYLGIDVEPKLDLIAGQLTNIEALREAATVCRAIRANAEYEISKEEALRLAFIYKAAFKELNLLTD